MTQYRGNWSMPVELPPEETDGGAGRGDISGIGNTGGSGGDTGGSNGGGGLGISLGTVVLVGLALWVLG